MAHREITAGRLEEKEVRGLLDFKILKPLFAEFLQEAGLEKGAIRQRVAELRPDFIFEENRMASIGGHDKGLFGVSFFYLALDKYNGPIKEQIREHLTKDEKGGVDEWVRFLVEYALIHEFVHAVGKNVTEKQKRKHKTVVRKNTGLGVFEYTQGDDVRGRRFYAALDETVVDKTALEIAAKYYHLKKDDESLNRLAKLEDFQRKIHLGYGKAIEVLDAVIGFMAKERGVSVESVWFDFKRAHARNPDSFKQTLEVFFAKRDMETFYKWWISAPVEGVALDAVSGLLPKAAQKMEISL